jgi:hypothetical protein
MRERIWQDVSQVAPIRAAAARERGDRRTSLGKSSRLAGVSIVRVCENNISVELKKLVADSSHRIIALFLGAIRGYSGKKCSYEDSRQMKLETRSWVQELKN